MQHTRLKSMNQSSYQHQNMGIAVSFQSCTQSWRVSGTKGTRARVATAPETSRPRNGATYQRLIRARLQAKTHQILVHIRHLNTKPYLTPNPPIAQQPTLVPAHSMHTPAATCHPTLDRAAATVSHSICTRWGMSSLTSPGVAALG